VASHIPSTSQVLIDWLAIYEHELPSECIRSTTSTQRDTSASLLSGSLFDRASEIAEWTASCRSASSASSTIISPQMISGLYHMPSLTPNAVIPRNDLSPDMSAK